MLLCNNTRGLSVAAGLVLLVASALLAAPTSAEPIFHPELQVQKAHGQIAVDGVLDDAGWQGAAQISNLVEVWPGNNTLPQVPTQIYVTYDDENFYASFVCTDDPATVHATMCQRDQLQNDDMCMITLDTYGDGSWAYRLFINPYGVQGDQMWFVNAPTDDGFDLIWKSAAQRTDSGYQVEVAIPFASLRFPDKDVQSWRMDFCRIRPRKTVLQYGWAARDRNQQCYPCQFGTVNGMTGTEPGRGVELLPAFVGYRNGERLNRDDFKDYDPKGELSLSTKYRPSSAVTVEATVNPDFSQIEADASQISVNSTTALFYPERRPFFNEGGDIFSTMFNSFYTRMVGDPSFAAKATGRLANRRFGFFSAVDEKTPFIIPLGQYSSSSFNSGRSVANVLRGIQTFGNSSQVGVMLLDRRFQNDGSGSVLSGDYIYQLSRTFSLAGQYILTHTKEMNDPALTARFGGLRFDDNRHTAAFDGESYWGTAFIQQIRHNSEHIYAVLDYNQISPSYRTTIGYDPVNDHRTASLFCGYSFLPKSGLVEQIQMGPNFFRRWAFDGRRENETNTFNCSMNLRWVQSHIDLTYSDLYKDYRGFAIDNLSTVQANFGMQPHSKVHIELGFAKGTDVAYFLPTPQKANELTATTGLRIKPVDRLTIGTNFQYYQISDRQADTAYADGYIARTRIQYQFAKELSLRLVAEYNDFAKAWNVDPLLTYRISPFSVFYAGSTLEYEDWSPSLDDRKLPIDWKLSRRQYFVKLQYLFQV